MLTLAHGTEVLLMIQITVWIQEVFKQIFITANICNIGGAWLWQSIQSF